jgi:DNA-binding NarL/FixJ family response regulator
VSGQISVVVADDQDIVRNGLAALRTSDQGIPVLGTAPDGRAAVDRSAGSGVSAPLSR